MSGRIAPRTLQGFRDYLPETMIPRETLMDAARRVYRSFGYSPIDTPALEYYEVLTGKQEGGSDADSGGADSGESAGGAETERQIYQFLDHGQRHVGLRFDLTVPLARFAAQHIASLGTPFKRYHLGAVWRGERPQRGRYREFMQCDFDTIGTKSVVADIETGLVMHELLRELGFERFTICANHRGVLNGLLERLGCRDRSVLVLRAIDKLAKDGPAKVSEELQAVAGVDAQVARQILEFATLSGSSDQLLAALPAHVAGSALGEEGVERLGEIVRGLRQAGVSDERFRIDVSIARGLDYYTGVVFETTLDDLPKIGSVCSGGRYDNLVELYSKQELPGIGASLGLDRLLAAMEVLGMLPQVRTPAQLLVTFFDSKRLGDYLRIAGWLRRAGIRVELYPEARKLGQQLKYADQRGFRLALVAGDRELAENRCQLKILATGEQVDCSLDRDAEQLVARIREALASNASPGE